ncbi:MAG: DNA internalization-related competence protein ComEC/Rec2 [Polyangiaceae bacterium]|nr:DNA internalization-related competence protein ComEC/Rec2 [Polyangiaceae bacterium]
MADPVLLAALALAAGAALARAPLPTALGAVLVALALRARARPAALAIAALSLLASGWRARAALDAAAARYARAVDLLQPPVRCEVRGAVVASPVVLGEARRAAGEPPPARAAVELTAGACGARAISEPVRARLYGAPVDAARGDQIDLVVDLAPVHLFRNEGLRDATASIARAGVTASGTIIDARIAARGRTIGAAIDRARGRVRDRIQATYHPGAAALGRALVLGETDLDPGDDEAFRESGLSHLLAVSGTHLVLAVAGLAAALRAILVRVGPIAARWDAGRITAAASIPAAWLYADFAGGGGSAQRAAAMLSFAMLARAAGLRPSGARSFALSLGGAALADPLVACDLSFGLSAAATAGLLWFNRPLAAALVRGPAPARKLLAPVATTLAAMLGCAPLLLLNGGGFPLLGVAANVVAAPIGELAALPFCLAHAALSWAPSVERGCALVGSGALLVVRAIARASSQLGVSVELPDPTPTQLAALACAAALAWAAPTRARRIAALAAGAAALILLEIAAIRAGAPRGRLRVTVLDVGQGDAVLVDLPGGGAMLVDAGGFVGSPVDTGARVVRPFRRARRRSRLDLVVLSHPHPDHFGGLPSALDGIEVGELWDTGQGEAEGAGPAYAGLLDGLRRRGVPVRRPGSLCGAPRIVAGATIEVLAPCPDLQPDRGANDNSFILRIRHGARAALLVGDAEHEAEEAVIARHGRALRADLLKVGHHGSRTSTGPAFLAAVDPSAAAISCGVRNRFGHPHPETLATLAAARGVHVARTDRGGAFIWETDGEAVWWRRPGGAPTPDPDPR